MVLVQLLSLRLCNHITDQYSRFELTRDRNPIEMNRIGVDLDLLASVVARQFHLVYADIAGTWMQFVPMMCVCECYKRGHRGDGCDMTLILTYRILVWRLGLVRPLMPAHR